MTTHFRFSCSKDYKINSMEKSIIVGKYCNKQYWCFFMVCSLFLLLFCHHSSLITGNSNGEFLFPNYANFNGNCSEISTTPLSPRNKKGNLVNSIKDRIIEENSNDLVSKHIRVNVELGLDSCSNRYIYIHDLPSRFNTDILKHCSFLNKWIDMCEAIWNMGLGPQATNSDATLQNKSWFATNQFMLEIIFHNRMKQYECLTNDSSMASAIYIPYYAGLDVGRYLWDGFNTSVKDSNAMDLVKWLTEKQEWKYMWGRDHFFVAGRITWDFRRQTDNESDWGSKLATLPEIRNMTMLTIESSPWSSQDFAIPYPTYFHPSSNIEVFEWQAKMRNQKRPYLFSFIGSPRPNLNFSIRSEIINQCLGSRKKLCRLLDCNHGTENCHNPVNVMKLFQTSKFCLQPSGDSYTRRSTFDSILAGCIPVFFHPGTAYIQYIWHLPKQHREYSVFIPENDIRDGNAKIEKLLLGISEDQVSAMREQVIRLIPKVIYADPRSGLGSLEDAFDVAVKGVLERVDTIRRDMKEGKSSSFDFPEHVSWKYYLSGTLGEHEWDSFFMKESNANYSMA